MFLALPNSGEEVYLSQALAGKLSKKITLVGYQNADGRWSRYSIASQKLAEQWAPGTVLSSQLGTYPVQSSSQIGEAWSVALAHPQGRFIGERVEEVTFGPDKLDEIKDQIVRLQGSFNQGDADKLSNFLTEKLFTRSDLDFLFGNEWQSVIFDESNAFRGGTQLFHLSEVRLFTQQKFDPGFHIVEYMAVPSGDSAIVATFFYGTSFATPALAARSTVPDLVKSARDDVKNLVSLVRGMFF
jgi:hypothetical protein